MFIGPDGKPIRDAEQRRRIKALAIPPAWTSVWICPRTDGHLQATGRDSKGRKQYRYHPRWREVRDETKYGRLVNFGQSLPSIRKRVERDLASPGLSREKVLAAVVQLLEKALIRVGNEQYARQNGSFGLTTLRGRHVEVAGSTIRFQFKGKSGKKHRIKISDRRLAAIVKRCRDIPGYELFQYQDENGQYQAVDSSDVNSYLRQVAGMEFSAKDFRTWSGTVLAAVALSQLGPVDSEREAKKNIARAVEQVAELLGNTAAVCRKCYIHPEVVDAYLDGTIQTLMVEGQRELAGLSQEEAAVLRLLRRRLDKSEGRKVA
jgi:DNA topoisomerase I